MSWDRVLSRRSPSLWTIYYFVYPESHIDAPDVAVLFKRTEIRWHENRRVLFTRPQLLWDYFVRLWILWNLEHFLEICFIVLAFFVVDNVIIKHLTGVDFNIFNWFWPFVCLSALFCWEQLWYRFLFTLWHFVQCQYFIQWSNRDMLNIHVKQIVFCKSGLLC